MSKHSVHKNSTEAEGSTHSYIFPLNLLALLVGLKRIRPYRKNRGVVQNRWSNTTGPFLSLVKAIARVEPKKSVIQQSIEKICFQIQKLLPRKATTLSGPIYKVGFNRCKCITCNVYAANF